MTTSADFDVTTETLPQDTVVLRVTGDLDLATAGRLEAAIEETGAPTHLLIDLTGCTFLDSSGVRVLAGARRRMADGKRIGLVVTDQSVLRVLEITGIDTAIPVHPSVEAAL